ncbi:kinesin-like protein KIF15, partial [Biomphalaria glabrata]
EAGSINKSLSVLGNVIMSLSYGKKTSHPLQKLQINIFVEGFNRWKNKDKNDSLCSSRLQFAKSAKQKKNKAVVIKDIHSNDQELQIEISQNN